MLGESDIPTCYQNELLVVRRVRGKKLFCSGVNTSSLWIDATFLCHQGNVVRW